MAFLGQGRVTNAGVMGTVLALQHALRCIKNPVPVGIVNDVVKISNQLLFHEIAQDIHVAIGFGIGGENIVIGNDDYFVPVPDLGIFAKFAFKDADRAGAANVMGHEDIGLDPDIVAGLDPALAAGPGEKLFSKCHSNC